MDFFNDEENLFLLFVKYIGKESDGINVYEFLFGNEEEKQNFFGQDFEIKPSGLVTNLQPYENSYSVVKKVRIDMDLDLAQDNLCYSFQDVFDGVCCLASQNIDSLDEYPKNGRLVLNYGERLIDVDNKLGKYHTFLT